ncbi:uncharacterized protein [Ptychodera flava]|uniref:uncharacterized protein n=1 Tax=Ptychodera flava TaxID=63121 RepID=UPI003969F999
MAHILTYCRIRPTTTFSQCFDWDASKVYIRIPEVTPSGRTSVDKKKTVDHEFGFGSLFGPHTSQDEVFDSVAKSIVNGFLSGYNGTIFAYGQTGSGKTFTVEGGARKYSDRGLAPRAVSLIYKSLESRQDEDISVHVSYLEIYQEVGYDLLNPSTRPGNVVTHLPKVHVVEGPNNTCVVRNLSQHLAADEHVAQSLLLQGQANRKVAETPMNQRSSRSHAVFTVHLTARSPGSEIITRSKLHLVDLAGSERASKTGISGEQLGEAKFINLSLHYLERVIVALQDSVKITESRFRSNSFGSSRNVRIGSASSTRSNRSRSSSFHGSTSRHIPYRNSLLTMVLRDSLGGNCLTAMIATISIEESNLGESISTCRFAQRVACIKNHASRNEELDDKMVIKRLRRRIAELEAEIACLKSVNSEGATANTSTSSPAALQTALDAKLENDGDSFKVPRSVSLSDDDKKLCVKVMHGFIGGRIRDPVSNGISDPYKFRECMQILREMLMRSYALEESQQQRVESAPPARHERRRERRSRTSSHEDDVIANETQKPMTDEKLDMPERIQSAPVSHGRRTQKDRERDHRRRIEEAHQVLSPRNSGSAQSRTRNNYKTPFEEKREKDIERIGAKVDRYLNSQADDQKELMEFQVSVKEQKLEYMEMEITNKLDALTESIAQQHAYILQLKRDREDTEVIVREKTVLNQLRNRQGKYERRLKFVKEQLMLFQHHQKMMMKSQGQARLDKENEDDPERADNISYKEQLIERYQFRDGRMDSRKVLEVLKKEERKQEKLQSRIEMQRIQAVSDHMTIKEAQTRSKLAEFQEKLKQAKEERQKHEKVRPSSSPASSWWYASRKENSNMSGNSENADFGSPATNGWANSTPKSSGELKRTWSGLSSSIDTPSNSGVSSRDKSFMNGSSNINSAYSSLAQDSDSNLDGSNPVKRTLANSWADQHHANSPPNRSGSYNTSSNSGTSVPNVSRRGQNGENLTVEDIEGDVTQNSLPSKKSAQKSLFRQEDSKDTGEVKKSGFDDSFLYRPARNPMMKMSRKQKENAEHTPASKNEEIVDDQTEMTFSPTEYTQNENRYSFDPKKFSLQSKTFDSAMSTMLDDRASEATTQSKEPPDLFSSSKWSNYSSGFGDSASQSGPYSASAGRSSHGRNMWPGDKGPDSNPVSVKEKLARYLDKAAASGANKRTQPIMARRRTQNIDYRAGDDISTFASSSLKLTSPSMESFGTDPLSMYMTSSFLTEDSRVTADGDVAQRTDTKGSVKSKDEKAKDSSKVSKDSVGDGSNKKMNKPKIKAMDESEREESYVSAIRQQKERVAKIRKAMRAAEVIQTAWRRHQAKKKR